MRQKIIIVPKLPYGPQVVKDALYKRIVLYSSVAIMVNPFTGATIGMSFSYAACKSMSCWQRKGRNTFLRNVAGNILSLALTIIS